MDIPINPQPSNSISNNNSMKNQQITIQRAWLERLATLGSITKVACSDDTTTYPKIAYLLGYIASAEELLKE